MTKVLDEILLLETAEIAGVTIKGGGSEKCPKPFNKDRGAGFYVVKGKTGDLSLKVVPVVSLDENLLQSHDWITSREILTIGRYTPLEGEEIVAVGTIISDGYGPQGGAIAEEAVNTFGKTLLGYGADGEYDIGIAGIMLEFSNNLCDAMAQAYGTLDEISGATAVAMVVDRYGNKEQGSIGDARIYKEDRYGSVFLLTRDHNVHTLGLEEASVDLNDPDEYDTHDRFLSSDDSNSRLTRAVDRQIEPVDLETKAYEDPDANTVNPGDSYLLVSDGAVAPYLGDRAEISSKLQDTPANAVRAIVPLKGPQHILFDDRTAIDLKFRDIG